MKRAAILALLASLSWLLVACGDDSEAANEDAPPPATATSTAEGTSSSEPTETAEPTATGGQASTPAAPTATAATGSTPAPETQVVPPTETGVPQPAEPVTSTYSIPTAELPLVRFEVDGGVELPVEVPPRSEYSIGLSGRTELEGRGMVFYREDFGQTGFWMKNTHIDLDIAFVDAQQRIIHITTMQADTLDIHRPDGEYVVAIEATAGWYAEHDIAEGDTVEYLFDLEATVTD